MLVQWWKKSCARLLSCSSVRTMHAHPCFNKCANQPGPDRTLMINRISCARVAFVVRRVSRFAGSERAQPDRRKQKHLDRIDNAPRFLFRQQCEWQPANGKDLVWSKCKIDSPRPVIAIDHIREITGVLVPEFLFESSAAFVEERLPTRGRFRANGERVQPERLNFHRLANARRDLATIDARVHPSELLTAFAS